MKVNIDNEKKIIIEDLKDNILVKSTNKSREKQHLQITRGNKVNLPTLLDGELALVKDEGKVYVGNDNENIALAKDSEVQEISQNLNQLKTNYFGKEFDTPQERFLNEFEYLNNGEEKGSFLPFSASKNHKIQESIEGKTRGMILEGETIQNLCIQVNNTLTPYQSNINCVYALKPSTTYTLFLKNNSDIPYKFYFNEFLFTASGTKTQEYGISKYLLTTKEDTSDLKIIKNSTDNVDYKIQGMLLEGNIINPPIEFFEGIKSIGQEENKISILSHGKNLFNLDKFKELLKTSLVEDLEDGVIVENRAVDLTAMVKFENKNYRFIYKREIVEGNGNSLFHVLYSNGTEKYLNGDDVFSGNNITKFEITYNNNGKTKLTDIILSDENNQNYEPYKQNKKDILISFTDGLKGIGSIKDEINSISNKAIQRVGKIIFTGDENWVTGQNPLTNTLRFSFNNNFIKSGVGHFINNKIKTDARTTYEVDEENMQQSGEVFFIRVLKSKLLTQDVAGFKALLKQWKAEGNPLTVYYPLATPTEYDLNQDINLNTYEDLTYIATEATSTFSAPVVISNTIARLNRENKSLEEENIKLKEETKNLTVENEYQQIDIDNNQLATVEIFEMIIGTMEVSNQKINNYKIGGITMVEVYVSLIIKGKKKIEDVPAIIRTQVETMLRELGVVE